MVKHPFAERIAEAHTLYNLAKGTPHEETCWEYLEATLKLARIAAGLRRRAFIQSLASIRVTQPAAQ
jgi:hypothetical protein